MEPTYAARTFGRLSWSLIVIGLATLAITLLAGRGQSGPGLAFAGQQADRATSTSGFDRSDLLASAKRVAAGREAQRERTQRRAAKREQALDKVRNAAGEPLSVSGAACEDNLALAAKHGLTLPDGWEIHCVGPGADWDGNSHWGVTCPYDACPEGAGPYVSISNPTYYVIAHELCHANYGNDELMADACAAKHGASLDTSPYQ
jgi:hypothetical protein